MHTTRLSFRLSFGLMLLAGVSSVFAAETYILQSPNERLEIRVDLDRELRWSVRLEGKRVIEPGALGMEIRGQGNIAANTEVVSAERAQVTESHVPAVAHKSSIIHEDYRELTLRFDNGFGVDFRAYNDGVAYRFVGTEPGEVIVERELLELNFPDNTHSLFPEEDSLISHYERHYLPENLSEIERGRFASLPVYMNTQNVHVVFTEADLFDYPGLFLYGTGGDSLSAGHAPVVTKAVPKPGSEDRNQDIAFGDYIAKTSSQRNFPWRLAVISDRDQDLVQSQLVWLLSRETELADTSWIKPGRIAWDWYNANNLFGVDFKAGINTETYKYYIDFASDYGLEYVILDEGWTKSTTEIDESNADIDIHELVRYGKERNVELILWALWGPLDKDYERILKLYADWGVAGVKIDFMQRADQYMVNYYEKIAREAAKHELLVDYHGGFKPSGLRRAYPNVLTYEGVKGNENNKWSTDVTPEHNVTLPFIRMLAGPMDFTPGALRNAQLQNHHINHYRPMSIGTRAHQVAMYAVYESALQMLCESPTTYQREPKVTEFISRFPAVWDETLVLDAKVADYILVARRKGDTWYLGAMTDASGRNLEVDFSFLGEGEYTLDLLRDGPNTENFAEDYLMESRPVSAADKLSIDLAPGGGWAAVVSKAGE